MATTTFLSSPHLHIQSNSFPLKHQFNVKKLTFSIRAQTDQQSQEVTQEEPQLTEQTEQSQAKPPRLESLPLQPQAKNKNMSKEYGSQWMSSVTRHIRIYAAYIDPITHVMDQTQMDKLTLLLDPQDEFVWTDESEQMVYRYFKELIDHYEGAPLTEYTLRLIGSDMEHYIRKMLYDGVIKYNMNAQVLNFSMGKPRVQFNNNQIPDVQ